jgi:ABC-type cobalt transport system substrate-binding protein
MKKVWKYIISLLVVIILASAGTIYYFLNVKTYDTADQEIEEIIESEYDIVLPVDIGSKDSETPVESTDETEVNKGEEDSSETATDETNTGSEENTTTNTKNTITDKNSSDTEKPNKDSTTTTKPSGGNTNSTPKEETEITVKNIKDKYRPVFQSLESQANGKIDALMARAIGEYHQKKANNASISYSYFYQKYTSAGRDLESKTDSTFNYIYNALEKELKENGYSGSHAKVFREQYEETKKARESALLNKAREAL